MSNNLSNVGAWAKPKKLPNDMVPKVGMNAPLTCVRIFNALNDEAENEKEAAYILYQNWSQTISNESCIMNHPLSAMSILSLSIPTVIHDFMLIYF